MINEVRNEYDNEPSRNLKMSDFTLGERKDEILKLCLKHPKQEAETKDFKRILFPNDTKDDIKLLLTLISEHDTEVIKIRPSRFDLHLQTNERTKSFIKDGGFTKIEKDELLHSENTDNKFNLNINNNFKDSTIGQINQSDFLKVDKTEIKQTIQPKTKENKQTAIISIVEKFWWQILIPLGIGIVLILIKKGIIDIGFDF